MFFCCCSSWRTCTLPCRNKATTWLNVNCCFCSLVPFCIPSWLWWHIQKKCISEIKSFQVPCIFITQWLTLLSGCVPLTLNQKTGPNRPNNLFGQPTKIVCFHSKIYFAFLSSIQRAADYCSLKCRIIRICQKVAFMYIFEKLSILSEANLEQHALSQVYQVKNASFLSAHDPHIHHHNTFSTWKTLRVNSRLSRLSTQGRGGHTTLLQFLTKHSK